MTAVTTEAFAERLAAALEDAITRNPLLSKDDYAKYVALLAEYGAKAESSRLDAQWINGNG